MENFYFQNKTKIIFGKNSHFQIGKEISYFSKKVLFLYGGGSIKKAGIYSEVVDSLKESGIEFLELGGVQPNPVISLAREGIDICKKNKIDFILAVGGGSVIDTAKTIALGVNYKGDVWDFFDGKAKPDNVLSIGVVLTIPAAGSESSIVTVMTNEVGLIKRGFHSELLLPVFAVLNPQFCKSLPTFQIACGTADILAHTFERYFTQSKNTDLTDRLSEGLIKTVIHNGIKAFKNPSDYDSMAEIMWSSTIAHNGLLGTGRIEDWASHRIAHEISGIYGITHGAALSVIFPAWMKYVYKFNINRFAQFAIRVFEAPFYPENIEDTAKQGISKLQNFFRQLNLPLTLQDLNINLDRIEEMAEKAVSRGPLGNFKKLAKEDIVEIYKLAY